MPLEYCHCIVILYCSLSHCQKFIIATFYSFSVGYFIVLSSDCFTMMSYWYCVSIVYACHLKLAFVHLLYLYLLCEHSITPCGLNKVYLILSCLIHIYIYCVDVYVILNSLYSSILLIFRSLLRCYYPWWPTLSFCSPNNYLDKNVIKYVIIGHQAGSN